MRDVLRVSVLVVVVGCGHVATPGDDDSGSDGSTTGRVVLTIAPSGHDFGMVATGSASAPQTFTVTNTGAQTSGAIDIAFVGGDAAHFVRVATTCGPALATGASCTIDAVLAPQTDGMFAIALAASDDSGSHTMASLQGKGVIGTMSISPSVDSYGQVMLGTVADHTFTVRNTTAVPIAMPVPTIGGTTVYTLGATDCTATLAPDATCSLTVHFAPQAVGAQAASVTLSSGTGTAMAQLTGTGASQLVVTRTGPGAITGAGIDCGTVCSAIVTSSPITLTAAPSAGASFTTWGGGAAGCANATTCTIAVTTGSIAAAGSFADIPTLDLTVHNVDNGTIKSSGTILIQPVNETCGLIGADTTCSIDIPPQTVTLTPVNDCSTFKGWVGACFGMTGTCTLTLTADVATTARFDVGPCN